MEFIPYNDVEALKRAVDEETAAVILEPVQGEGGVRPATPEFLRAAREITQEKGALLILDEIQTGMGRTGKRFAFEHFGIVPDILTLAMAAGVAAIRYLERTRLWERAAELGPWFMEKLRAIPSPKIREVRGMGLMVGLELKEKAAPYIARLEKEHRVLALQAGPTVIRFLPPLVIEKEDLERVVEAVRAVLA